MSSNLPPGVTGGEDQVTGAPDSVVKRGRLILDEDGGGPRHFLDGRPVSCGSGLEMKVPGDKWVRVRYEASLVRGPIRVYLYANPWSASRPHKAEREDSNPLPFCVQCERKFSRGYDGPCDEPEWGPTVVVAGRPDDFEREPWVTLRWPVKR
jgi:hypothetical protein